MAGHPDAAPRSRPAPSRPGSTPGVDFLIAGRRSTTRPHAWVTIGCSVDLGLFTLQHPDRRRAADLGPRVRRPGRDVDLDIVSFTIAFGAARDAPPPVGWRRSRTQLPAPARRPGAAARPPMPRPRGDRRGHGRRRPGRTSSRPRSRPASIKATCRPPRHRLDPRPRPLPDRHRRARIPANHASWSHAGQDATELPNVVAYYQQAPRLTAPGRRPRPGTPCRRRLDRCTSSTRAP